MSYILGMVAEIELWADDLDAMLTFYRDQLGFQQVSPPEQSDPIYLMASNIVELIPQMVVLCQKPNATSLPSYPLQKVIFGLNPNTIFNQIKDFNARGIVMRDHAKHPIYMGYTFIIDDPMGNEIKFVGLTGPRVVEFNEDGSVAGNSPMKWTTPEP